MTKEKFWNLLLIFAGLLPVWSGLQYFIAGEANQSSDLRNFAVVGQILFGLATICYGIWRNKNLFAQTK